MRAINLQSFLYFLKSVFCCYIIVGPWYPCSRDKNNVKNVKRKCNLGHPVCVTVHQCAAACEKSRVCVVHSRGRVHQRIAKRRMHACKQCMFEWVHMSVCGCMNVRVRNEVGYWPHIPRGRWPPRLSRLQEPIYYMDVGLTDVHRDAVSCVHRISCKKHHTGLLLCVGV